MLATVVMVGEASVQVVIVVVVQIPSTAFLTARGYYYLLFDVARLAEFQREKVRAI